MSSTELVRKAEKYFLWEVEFEEVTAEVKDGLPQVGPEIEDMTLKGMIRNNSSKKEAR